MNGNADPMDEAYDDEAQMRELAAGLADRTLTAIGGLDTDDPDAAAEIVARLYLRMLRAVREEE